MDIGQVCLGSMVFPFLMNNFDIIKMLTGLVITIGFWIISVLLVKSKK